MRALIAIGLVLMMGFAFSAPNDQAIRPHQDASNKNGDARNAQNDRDKSPSPQAKTAPASGKIELVSRTPDDSDGHWPEPKFILDALLLAATIAIAIYTARLFYVTRGLLIAAQEQFPHFKQNVQAAKDAANAAQGSADAAKMTVETMEKNAVRELRAYMNIVEAKLVLPEKFPGVLRAQIVVKNSGKTPAYKTSQWIAISKPITDGVFQDVRPEQGTKLPVAGVIAPDGKTFFDTPTAGLVSPDQWDGLQRDHITLFIYGEVLYTDAFNVKRTTKFRLQTLGAGVAKGYLTFCEEGNEAD